MRVLGESAALNEIDARAVDSLIAQRLSESATRHTVGKELGALRGVLRHARRRGEYDVDPASVLPTTWESGYKPRRRVFTAEQVDAVLGELAPARAAAIAFIVATGARWGETVRARRADIDLRTRLVRLRGTKTEASARVVPIPDHTLRFARVAYAAAAAKGQAFPPWTNVRRDIASACRRAEVPAGSPNDFRRTAATLLVEIGVPTHAVGYFLGHTSSRMVERVYGRIEGAELGDLIRSTIVARARRPGAHRARHARRNR